MSTTDLYALLKILPSASSEEVTGALTREQRLWSRRASTAPNLADRQEAEQRVAQLSVARKTLLDSVARSRYDSSQGPSGPDAVHEAVHRELDRIFDAKLRDSETAGPRSMPMPPQGPRPSQGPVPPRGPALPFTVSPQGVPVVPQSRVGTGASASFGQRFLASVIDSVVASLIYAVVLVTVGKSGGAVFGLVAATAYFVLLEGGARGAGFGKRALRLRVVDVDTGGPIGPRRALVRQLGKYVSAIPLGLGYLWMLWDRRGQTWHDKFAGDVVVKAQ